MHRFGEGLPQMGEDKSQVPEAAVAAGPEALAAVAAAKMRCGGCGSKVGASVLSRVLRRRVHAVHDLASLQAVSEPPSLAYPAAAWQRRTQASRPTCQTGRCRASTSRTTAP